MVLVTLLWSTAGVVTRQLDSTRSFELTFWRSAFTAAALLVLLPLWQGPGLWRRMRATGVMLWLSGTCWAAMFTCFMLAMTLTSVANVLITMALGPLLTALVAWLNPDFLWWLAPIVVSLVLSPVVSVLTSRTAPGLAARRSKLFLIPEEHKANPTAALKRSGQPEEIVTAALYLASGRSSFTTGSLVRVDGGIA